MRIPAVFIPSSVMFLVTIAFASITTLSAIVIFFRIHASVPIYTLFPILGAPDGSFPPILQ